jgi:hypothetical protein
VRVLVVKKGFVKAASMYEETVIVSFITIHRDMKIAANSFWNPAGIMQRSQLEFDYQRADSG